MTVSPLLNATLAPLNTADSVGYALSRLAGDEVSHLPVVDMDGRLVALVAEEALMNLPSPERDLGTLLAGPVIHALPDAHVFEAAHLMRLHRVDVLPVADEDGQYVGMIERKAVFERFADMLATETPGAIVVLDIPRRDYTLGSLAYAIEQNDVLVLSVSSEAVPEDPTMVRVTLKLNVADTARVRHVLDHLGYRVVAVYNELESDDAFFQRVQEFVRYLEV